MKMRSLILSLLASFACVPLVAAQSWVGHVSGLQSAGEGNLGAGFAFGGGVLTGNRFGVGAEFGYLAGSPLLSVGGSWRATRPRRVVPFVSGGGLRLGDLSDVYAGAAAAGRRATGIGGFAPHFLAREHRGLA